MVFVDTMPEIDKMEPETLYISEKYQVAVGLCLCGCKEQYVLPLHNGGWVMTKENNGTVTFSPSILNTWCNSHYIIRKSIANFV